MVGGGISRRLFFFAKLKFFFRRVVFIVFFSRQMPVSGCRIFSVHVCCENYYLHFGTFDSILVQTLSRSRITELTLETLFNQCRSHFGRMRICLFHVLLMTHGVFMIIVCYLDCYLQHYIINIIALYFIQTLTQFDIEDIEPISQYFFSVNEH